MKPFLRVILPALVLLCAAMPGGSGLHAQRGPTRWKRRSKKRHRAEMRQLKKKLKAKYQKKTTDKKGKISTDLKGLGVRPAHGPSRKKAEQARYLERLRDPDPERRADAAWWLGVHRVHAARGRLIKLLKDRYPKVRAHAVYALGLLGVRHMASSVFDILERDRSVEVKGRAAETLGRFRYRRALPLLIQMLRSKDLRMKMGALAGLGHMAEPATLVLVSKFTRHADPQIRAKAAAALGRMGRKQAVVHLNRCLDDSEGPVVAAAVLALAALKATGLVPRMERLLTHGSAPVRRATVRALAALNSVASLKAIVQLARKATPLTTAECARAAGLLGGKVHGGLLNRLLNSRDNRIRVLAVESAGMTGARWAIRKIVKLLDHPYTALRRAACVALGRLEAYGAVEKLVERLKDPDKEVRMAAIEALGRTGGRRALAACAILLADRSPEVAAVAADCLARQARYGWELARHAGRQLAAMLRLKADPALAAAAARALAVTGVTDNRTAMVRLLRLTLHPRAKCRQEAAWALGFVGRADIRETRRCLERLFNRDSSLEVRLHAGLAAGRLRMRKILPHLAKLFREQKGDKQLVPRLIAAMGLAMMERGWRQEAIRLFLRVASSRPNLPEKIRLVEMMASLGTRWSRSALRRALTSPNAMVRAEIRRLLGIKPPPPVPPPPDSAWPAHAAPSTEPAGRKSRSRAAPMRPVQSNRSIAGPFPLPKESRRPPRRGCGCGCRIVGTRVVGGSAITGLMWLALVSLLAVIFRSRSP